MPSCYYPKEWAEQDLSRADIKTRQIEHAKHLLIDEGIDFIVHNMGYHFEIFDEHGKVADFWPTTGRVYCASGPRFTGINSLINYMKPGGVVNETP